MVNDCHLMLLFLFKKNIEPTNGVYIKNKMRNPNKMLGVEYNKGRQKQKGKEITIQ